MSHLFTYGTLQLPEVFAAVTGQRRLGQPARIEEYARYRLKDLSYPGLVAETGTFTDGILYPDLDAEVWVRLDRFEDVFYRRETLKATSPELGELAAEVYVVPSTQRGLIDRRTWSLDEFCQHHLSDFMHRCFG